MIWRLIVVSWVLALVAGLVVYFSGEVFSVFNLPAEAGLRVLNLSELAATLLAIVGTVGLCAKLMSEYVFFGND